MISWLKLEDDNWMFVFNGYSIECKSLRDIVVCSLEAGLSWKQMHVACDEMDKNDHNYCEFGLRKTFTFSTRV